MPKMSAKEKFRRQACARLNGTYKGGKCYTGNPGIPIPLPRFNPAGKKMPTQAEKGLKKAERNYPRPKGKRFPVGRRKILK